MVEPDGGAHRRRLVDEELDLFFDALTAATPVTSVGWADKMGPDLADSMVVTTGRHAYRDHDGIAIVPAALLGP